MTRTRALSRLAIGLLLTASTGCAVFAPRVARTVDGVTTEGRYIEMDAYALYALAAVREARGQWREALDLYQRAYAVDGRGPELRTRIGAVACKLGRYALADRSFADALASDDAYGPLWFELGQCRRARGDLSGAQDAAAQALRLDPERVESSLLWADVAEQRGDREAAWRMRDALLTHAPSSLPALRAILAAAEHGGDARRAERARSALDELRRRGEDPPHVGGLARALASLRQGDASGARAEAERLLGADPGHGDALVVALAATDLQQDHDAFALLLQQTRPYGTPVSPELLGVLESLLARRVSAQAAQLVRTQP